MPSLEEDAIDSCLAIWSSKAQRELREHSSGTPHDASATRATLLYIGRPGCPDAVVQVAGNDSHFDGGCLAEYKTRRMNEAVLS